MVSARVRAGLAGLVLMLCASTASAQTAPTLTGSANGLNVSLSWTAVAGATGYDVIVSLNGSAPLVLPAGNITSLNVPAPPGVYQIAVRATAGAAAGPPSNVVSLTVADVPPAPPAAPTALSAAVNGNAVLLTWNLASTDRLLGLALQVGNSQGAADVGTFPIRVSTSAFLAHVPNGNYFMRLFAVGAGGFSAASNELNLAVPSCSALPQIPLTSSGQGNIVALSWPQVPGAVMYRLDVATVPGGPLIASQPFPPSQTSFQLFGAPEGSYFVKLFVQTECGSTSTSAEVQLDVTAPVRLPAKGRSTVQGMVREAALAMAAQFPGDLRNSCREHGGNNIWMFRVLQRLRSQDNRFGLNWKRGNVGDLSQDVVLYHFGDGPDELANGHVVYGFDIIAGHCGSPGPNWIDITNTSSPGARWTIAPYIQAGFTP